MEQTEQLLATYLTRRQVARLALAGMTATILSTCGIEANPATSTPIPSPTRSFIPTPAPSRPMLRSDNIPGFYVRYIRPIEALNRDTWTLTVEGLVGNRQVLTYPEVLSLERANQVSRMKCVECWSAAAKWEGFHLSTLLQLVNPQPDAKWVHMRCADGYHESMSVEALLRERVLFVHHMNDALLPDEYGAPLRLMVPSLYGYKSAKVITRLVFAPDELAGFWPSAGPYTTHGTIRQGRDNPLDLVGTRPIAGGGEIFYPDGIESQ